MMFVYIIIGAVSAILILLIIERYRSKQSLLQIARNWCTIDNVHFEKHLKKIQVYTTEKNNKQINSVKKYLDTIDVYFQKNGKSFRSYIRQKLGSNVNKQDSSQFIEKMKEK